MPGEGSLFGVWRNLAVSERTRFSHFTPRQKPSTANFSPFNALPLPSPPASRKFAQAGEKRCMTIRKHNLQLALAAKTLHRDCGRMFSNPSR
jgi:hypothetical protein